jgi:ATP-dependent helicase/nuclease subunit A
MSSRSSKPDSGAQPSLFGVDAAAAPEAAPAGLAVAGLDAPEDEQARLFAVDPRNNVILEASAGTGKTSVLVARYVNLLKAGVEPANILAITFTRKAAAEMRERIVRELRDSAALSEADRRRWLDLRDRLGEIAISTIDAFCLSLLREFPLEADVDPGFEMADETEVPRLIEASLDRSLRILTSLARREPEIALVLAQLGLSRTREGLAALLERRLVAWGALDRFLDNRRVALTSGAVCSRTLEELRGAFLEIPGGLEPFLEDGPTAHPRYQWLMREIRALASEAERPDAETRSFIDRVGAHFLTLEGKPRSTGQLHPYKAEHYPSPAASKRHRAAVAQFGGRVEVILSGFARDLNAIMARGVRRMFAIALSQYRRALDERSVLDFSDVLQRALDLLRQMDEFSQSRFRLESRYHHVLVDEFQDTSRAQWELVSLLVQSWGEGLGLASQPSIFIVGDRKQSIYRFRDAEVAVLREAGQYIEGLRRGRSPRRSIARSFRAVPELLAFVNDAFAGMSQGGNRPDAFTYDEKDRFPVTVSRDPFRGPALGIAVDDDPAACAAAVAAEIARVLREDTVRDRRTGVARAATPGDIAILFRSRASHRDFEQALERAGIPTYVYKGLGFFDADEMKDVVALIRYLARPASDLRAAAFLRSRFVRISDAGLAALAPRLAASLTSPAAPVGIDRLTEEDRRVLMHARAHAGAWLQRVDRVPPADLLEEILVETAYAYELRGARRMQAWENLKKIRAIVRRIQNRGYATLPRIADHLDALTAGDEPNAIIEALDAVNLMTVHASKGLEFPIVFVVNMAKGASGPPRPIRVTANGDEPSVSIGPFKSESDEAEREGEKHETRRLLYVAFTRARDRLYLASTLKKGALAPGRGSLAEVLPDSLKALFAAAGAAAPNSGMLEWAGPSGSAYVFKICRNEGGTPAASPPGGISGTAADLLGPASMADEAARLSISRWLEQAADAASATDREEARTDVVVGRLVHRLLQFSDAPDAADPEAISRRATALLTSDERGTVEDVDAVVDAALRALAAIRARPDVAELLASGDVWHEVPFSMADPGSPTILRGTIDCLVRRPGGGLTVLEFKTGAPRPSHERQLELYVQAVKQLFRDVKVDGLLVYS